MTQQPDRLAVLVDRAATGRLLPAEGPALRQAAAELQQQLADEQAASLLRARDLEQARRTAGGLMAKVQQLGAALRAAEDELAEWRNGRHATQLAIEDGDEWFDNVAGEYPPLDSQRHMLRRGRWVPIDDGPSVDQYPTAS